MRIKKYFGDSYRSFLILVILIFIISIICAIEIGDEYDGNNKLAEILALPIYYFFFPILFWDIPHTTPAKLQDIIWGILMILNLILNILIAPLILSQIYIKLMSLKSKN